MKNYIANPFANFQDRNINTLTTNLTLPLTKINSIITPINQRYTGTYTTRFISQFYFVTNNILIHLHYYNLIENNVYGNITLKITKILFNIVIY